MNTRHKTLKFDKSVDAEDMIVSPVSMSKKGRSEMLAELKEIRQRARAQMSEKDRVITRFLQLKFLIEDYLAGKGDPTQYFFGYFLKEYISRQDKKSKDFAHEIDVDPAELSNIIQKKRKPTEKLIYRLDIHSNKNFPAEVWFHIVEKDRIVELSTNKAIIEREKPHVKRKLEFSI